MKEQRIRMATWVVVLILLAAPAAAMPVHAAPTLGVVYVSTTGNDAAGCGALGSPCRTIQRAVNIAADHDEIRVATGVYTYDAAVDPCSSTIGTTGVVCLVNKQVQIRGGYNANFSSQDAENQPSIIDGQQQRRGVMALRTAGTTRLEMEGFVIKNGLASPIPARGGDDTIFALGGGMFADMGATRLPGNEVILTHVVFRNNVSVAANSSGPYGGSGVGGGAALRNVALAQLQDVRFEANVTHSGCGAQWGGYSIGGGLHADRSIVYATHVEFVDNQVLVPTCNVVGHSFGHGDALGGGVATQSGEMTLQHVLVKDNLAQGGNTQRYAGGAFGGGVFNEFGSLTIEDSVVRDNVAQGGNALHGGIAGGGGVDSHDGTIHIRRTHVINNVAQGGNSTGGGNSGSPGGGGLYLVRLTGEGSATVSNSVVAANVVQYGAGATATVGGGGAGVWLQGISSNLVHVTIADNHLGGQPMQGDAILVLSVGTTPRPAYVESTIIANHSSWNGLGVVHTQENNTIVLNRTLWSCNYIDSNAGRAGAGIVQDFNPVYGCPVNFVAPGAPSFDYHLADRSPAIDQAVGSTATVDIDGQPRPVGAAPDIGADEAMLDTLSMQVYRPASQKLQVVWQAGPGLVPLTHHFALVVECAPGASPPQEGACGQPIPVGLQTQLLLTKLTNGVSYTISVHAYDASGELLKTSNLISIKPGQAHMIFVPLITR